MTYSLVVVGWLIAYCIYSNWYRIKLNCFLFTNRLDYSLNTLINILIKNHTIIAAKQGRRMSLNFESGFSITFWNANKYYGFMTEGEVHNPAGDIIYYWKDVRPTAKTMYKMEKKITEFYKKEFEAAKDKLCLIENTQIDKKK